MSSIFPVCSYKSVPFRLCPRHNTHLIRIEDVNGGLGSRPGAIPHLRLGIFFSHIEMEGMVVLRSIVPDDCQRIWFVEAYPERNESADVHCSLRVKSNLPVR